MIGRATRAEAKDDFKRLVGIVYEGLADRPTGGGLPDVALKLKVTPADIAIGVEVDGDFIPGVNTHAQTLGSGTRDLDDLARDLLDDLAMRALKVGRTRNERRA